jgi:hypothetical protein
MIDRGSARADHEHALGIILLDDLAEILKEIAQLPNRVIPKSGVNFCHID